MSGERLRFRERPRPADSSGQVWGLAALLLIAGAMALARPMWMPRVPDGVLVEVVGDVPHPGTYLVAPPTLYGAVRAAGLDLDADEDGPLVPAGHQVVVRDGQVSVRAPSDPLLVALPVDVNLADADGLAAIPGLSRATAAAIVGDRDARGPFYALDDLRRVRGVGPSVLDAITPFTTVGEPGERPPAQPLDLNRATAWQLEALPGIGPVTAARIVVYREDRGAFTAVEELDQVQGIGEKTLARLAGLVEVR